MNLRDLYNKFDGHCAYCGKKIEFDDMTIDHVVPSSKGGKTVEGNIVPACHLCNGQKANKSVEEFREYIANIAGELDENKQYRLGIRYKKVVPVKAAPVVFYFEKEQR